jgi:outer membrane murein-binding lipoprotein Lpp
MAIKGFWPKNGVKMKAKAAILTLLLTAGCTDLKPLDARIEDLQSQVDKLHAEMAKSAINAATANRTTATSASAASGDAKQALSVGEANTKAIEALNSKIDQMFRKRPAE